MKRTPFPEITTKRLRLRQATKDDCREILFLRSDEEVNRYVKRPTPQNLKEAEEWLEKINRQVANDECFYWAITLKGDTKMIGSISLWNYSADRIKAEVGYDLSPAFQNQGIMTEALMSVLAFAFGKMKFKMIEAFTDYRNALSQKLLMNQDFTLMRGRMDKDNINNRIYVLEETSAEGA